MPPTPPASPRRSVLIIGSEALPFSKTGGLADVLGALPPALARLGWDVTLFTPRYRGVDAGELREQFWLSVGGYYAQIRLYEAPLGDGARAMLVDAPGLFDRDFFYGYGNYDYPDNPRRFAVLVRAALEWALRQPTGPDIVHAHDWQAGLAPVYLRSMYALNPTIGRARAVFTIHNLAYQGRFDSSWMPQLELGWHMYNMHELEFFGSLCFMKGGVVASDYVTTVSPNYATEIQTPEGGVGFDGVLRARGQRLVGILNGIDTQQWDPEHDRFLPEPFSIADMAGKRAAKKAVLGLYGLPADESALARPLIGMISRMVDQKGLDLIARIAPELSRLDASYVVLGTGEPRYQDMWRRMALDHPDRIGVRIGFDEGLAHLIEGGADMFLMPSLFEPCGLNQMYSLRYGTVPIVRRVGGLADTVQDYWPGRFDATGFVFNAYSEWELLDTIKRAIWVYTDNPAAWRALQVNGMGQDLSWDRSAREYVKIYEDAITRGRP
ncbi:MAG TPA: glycogen synthase GlgA [Vicinamibacterales bacterium]|nr:glycogen synthase GlgA [Vicinamibacterales bacterium]